MNQKNKSIYKIQLNIIDTELKVNKKALEIKETKRMTKKQEINNIKNDNVDKKNNKYKKVKIKLK